MKYIQPVYHILIFQSAAYFCATVESQWNLWVDRVVHCGWGWERSFPESPLSPRLEFSHGLTCVMLGRYWRRSHYSRGLEPLYRLPEHYIWLLGHQPAACFPDNQPGQSSMHPNQTPAFSFWLFKAPRAPRCGSESIVLSPQVGVFQQARVPTRPWIWAVTVVDSLMLWPSSSLGLALFI